MCLGDRAARFFAGRESPLAGQLNGELGNHFAKICIDFAKFAEP
jgi:hypothetical protein